MGQLRPKGISIATMCLWICWVLVVANDAKETDEADWQESVDNVEVELGPEDSEGLAENYKLQKEATTLRCHRRIYKSTVEQFDAAGRRCWDTLALEACWGRCDSHEISEWKFPYKRSKHPVCIFGARKPTITKLQHCDEEADPETRIYRHVKPITCRCQACSSTNTSCGWLPLSFN